MGRCLIKNTIFIHIFNLFREFWCNLTSFRILSFILCKTQFLYSSLRKIYTLRSNETKLIHYVQICLVIKIKLQRHSKSHFLIICVGDELPLRILFLKIGTENKFLEKLGFWQNEVNFGYNIKTYLRWFDSSIFYHLEVRNKLK